MTLQIVAPPWPIRVVAVESRTEIVRGRPSEFRHHGIALSRHVDGRAALRTLAKEPESVMFIPTDMSDISVLDFVEIVVGLTHASVLIGLAPNSPDDIVAACIEYGALGTVALPVTPAKFVSAVAPIQSAHNENPAIELHCGRLTLNDSEHRVFVDGIEVYMAPKEFEVLKYIMSGFPRMISIDELARIFAPNDLEHATSVRVAVYRIRTKLDRASPGFPSVIETVRGLGYRVFG
jgi:DNA-binding response OmpR family regulator